MAPPPLECTPVPSLLAAPITSHRLRRGLWLLALEVLRGISGGASTSTPGGGRAHHRKHTSNFIRVRRTGFYLCSTPILL